MTKEELSIATAIILNGRLLRILDFYVDEIDDHDREDTILKTTDGPNLIQYFSWGYLEEHDMKLATKEEYPEYFL